MIRKKIHVIFNKVMASPYRYMAVKIRNDMEQTKVKFKWPKWDFTRWNQEPELPETSIPTTAEVTKQSIATALGLYQNLFAASVWSTALLWPAFFLSVYLCEEQWRTRGGVRVFKPPPRNSEGPPKNRAKLNPIVKTVKKISEFRMPTHQDVRKKGGKILQLPRFTIVLH